MTETEFRAMLKQCNVLSHELARRAMRQSHCRWIDVAIEEGWSKSLEDLMRSAARESLRTEPQRPPPLSWFDSFPISEQDHSYFKQHGQAHLWGDLAEIKAARVAMERREARKMFGEAAE